VKGPCAVIGSAQGQPGAVSVVALRVLPAGRPWLTPAVPDWVRHFTDKKHCWEDSAPIQFVQRARSLIELTDTERKGQDDNSRAMPFILVHSSRLDAESEVNALDNNNQMPSHRKRQEILRRYLSPFKPIMPLCELPGARLWKAEAQNAHELDVERFAKFFACAENVIGKEGGR
jgi:hypothetical protein